MGLITKLKSLLGFDDGRSQPRRSGGNVTVERERQRDAEAAGSEPETLSESAGMGEEETAAEPSEATGPADEAGQPAQTEETEPEETPVIEEAEPEEEPEPEVEEPEPEIEAESEPEAEETPEAAEEPEPEPAVEEPEPSGADLDDIKGIGPAYAQRLRDAGIDSVDDLANADAADLADEIEVSEKRVSAWIDRAKAR